MVSKGGPMVRIGFPPPESFEPGRANWAINSPVVEEDCYLLANARATWLTAS